MKRTDKDKLRFRTTSRALPIALLRAREVIMTPIRDNLHDIDLTEQKWRILRTLSELGEVEQSTISKEACIMLSSLTRTLRSLEKDGYIHRKQDVDDKRRILVSISDKGEALIQDNIIHALEIYASIEDQLGREKITQLLDLLEEVRNLKL